MIKMDTAKYITGDNLIALSRRGFSEQQLEYNKKHGYSHYQIRHHDSDFGEPETIEPSVTVNHYCDIILKEPIDFSNTDHVYLSSAEKSLLKHYF